MPRSEKLADPTHAAPRQPTHPGGPAASQLGSASHQTCWAPSPTGWAPSRAAPETLEQTAAVDAEKRGRQNIPRPLPLGDTAPPRAQSHPGCLYFSLRNDLPCPPGGLTTPLSPAPPPQPHRKSSHEVSFLTRLHTRTKRRGEAGKPQGRRQMREPLVEEGGLGLSQPLLGDALPPWPGEGRKDGAVGDVHRASPACGRAAGDQAGKAAHAWVPPLRQLWDPHQLLLQGQRRPTQDGQTPRPHAACVDAVGDSVPGLEDRRRRPSPKRGIHFERHFTRGDGRLCVPLIQWDMEPASRLTKGSTERTGGRGGRDGDAAGWTEEPPRECSGEREPAARPAL